MEDAHAAVLELQPEAGDRSAFFAVYDGHGGEYPFYLKWQYISNAIGGTVAKFSGNNVHKRLVTEDSYKEQQWADALKRAFLGTDEDIRAG